MDNRMKYIIAAMAASIFMGSAYIFPAETFLIFTVGWLFFIPAAFVTYMIYGLISYMKDRKHKIVVEIKPTEAMKAIARREAELQKEKERLLYQEYKELKE